MITVYSKLTLSYKVGILFVSSARKAMGWIQIILDVSHVLRSVSYAYIQLRALLKLMSKPLHLYWPNLQITA